MIESNVRLSWSDFVFELAERTHAIPNPPPLYLVGGAVRDAYMRGAIGDIDIAVDGDAIALARYVVDAWSADIYIMDRERDVARIFIKRDDSAITIDFARLRGATLEDDLRDRDFTMNAMAADLLGDPGALLDPLNGVDDLRQNVLRRCSPRSIANDPIRMVRAVRLCAQFDLKIHPDTAADIRRHAADLRNTSRERVRDEFFKLLALEKAARGLRALAHLGVLAQILPLAADRLAPSLATVERMTAILAAISSRRTDNTAAAFDLGMLVIQLDRFRARLQDHLEQNYGNGRRHAELLTLAALLHHLGEAPQERASRKAKRAEAVARSLRLTKQEQRYLRAAVENSRAVIEGELSSVLEIHRFWYRLGESGIDAILVGAAIVLSAAGSELKQADWLQFVEHVTTLLDAFFNHNDTVVNPALFLDGNDIQELLGIGRGRRIGRILTSLREAQAAGDVASVSEARELVKRMGADAAE